MTHVSIPPNIYFIGDPVNVLGLDCIHLVDTASESFTEIKHNLNSYYLLPFTNGIYKTSTNVYITIDHQVLGIIPISCIEDPNLLSSASQVGFICNLQDVTKVYNTSKFIQIGYIEINCESN